MKSTSKAPKKQRRLLSSMPLHEKRKRLSSHLSKELREKMKKRSAILRTNDIVKVMKGFFAGKTGKVVKTDYVHSKVSVEKMTRKKADGSEVMVPMKAAHLMIIELDKTDARRFGQNQAKPAVKTEARKEAKPEIKAVKPIMKPVAKPVVTAVKPPVKGTIIEA